MANGVEPAILCTFSRVAHMQTSFLTVTTNYHGTMKLSLSLLLGALVAPFTLAQDSDDRNCITNVDPNTDYFPVKAFPTESKLWTVSYHNTYKIVENLATNSSFLLYQCGSEPPADEVDAHTQVIEIPVRNVGVEQTVTIPYLDTLEELDEVVIFMTDVKYVSSPCFLDRINDGQVLVAANTDEQSELITQTQQAGNQDLLAMLANMVAFVGPFSTTPFEHPVEVSAYLEKTNGAIYEWLKFYSLFFNKEEIANEAVAAATDRFECVTENAARIEADFPAKPVVLWGSYSDYCGGWKFAKCPNYYCEIAQACSTEILFDELDGGSLNLCGGYIFKTLEEFIEFGKDADYWFYDNDNVNLAIAEFGESLQDIKAFRNKQVFDYQGAGPNKWYVFPSDSLIIVFYTMPCRLTPVFRGSSFSVGTRNVLARTTTWYTTFVALSVPHRKFKDKAGSATSFPNRSVMEVLVPKKASTLSCRTILPANLPSLIQLRRQAPRLELLVQCLVLLSPL